MERTRLGAMSRLDKRGGLEFDRQGFFSNSVCSFDDYSHYRNRQHGNGMNNTQAALLQGLLKDTELQFEQFTKQQPYSSGHENPIADPINTIQENLSPAKTSARRRSKSRSRSQTVPTEVDFTQRNLQDNLSKSYNINSQGNIRQQRKRTPMQYVAPSHDIAQVFQHHPNLNILDGAPSALAPREMLVQKQTLYTHPGNKENLALAEAAGNVRPHGSSSSSGPGQNPNKLGSKSAIDWGIDQEVEQRAHEETERPLHVGQDIIYINNKPFQVLARDPDGSLDSRHVTIDRSKIPQGSNSSTHHTENVSNNNHHTKPGSKNHLRSASLGNFQGEMTLGRQGNRRRHKNTHYRPPMNMQVPLSEQDIDSSLSTHPSLSEHSCNAPSHPNTSPVSDIDYTDMHQHAVTSKQQQTWMHDRGSGSSNDRVGGGDNAQKQAYQNWMRDSSSDSIDQKPRDPRNSSASTVHKTPRGTNVGAYQNSFQASHAINQTFIPSQLNEHSHDARGGSVNCEKAGYAVKKGIVQGYPDTDSISRFCQANSNAIINSAQQPTTAAATAQGGRRRVEQQHTGVLQQYHISHTPIDSFNEQHDRSRHVYHHSACDDDGDNASATDIGLSAQDLSATSDNTDDMIAIQRTSPNGHPINDGLATKQDRPKSSKLRSRKPVPVEDTFTAAVSGGGGGGTAADDLKIELGDLCSHDQGKGRRAKRYLQEENQSHAPQKQILKKREKVGPGPRPQSAWRQRSKVHDDNGSSSDDTDVDGEIEILDLDIIEPFSDEEGTQGKSLLLVHDETGSTTSSERVMTPRLTEREMCDLRLEKMHSIKKCRRRFLSDSSINNENEENPLPETTNSYSPPMREGSSMASSEQNAGITPELVYQHYGNRVVDNYRRRATSDVSILADSKLNPTKSPPKDKPAKLKPLVPHGSNSAGNSSDGDSARDNRMLPPLSKKSSNKKHRKAESTNVLISKPPVPGKSRAKLNPLPQGDGNTLSVNLSDVDADDDELENESRRLEREIAKLRSLALNQTPRSPNITRDDMNSDKFFSSTERDKTIVGHVEESKRSNLAKSRADLVNGAEHPSLHYNKGERSVMPSKRPLCVSRSVPMDGHRLHNRKKSLSDIVHDLKEGTYK